MSKHPSPDDLGEPSLSIAGLQVWIHGLVRPDASDPEDDWLRVTVHCGAKGASIFTNGVILRTTEFLGWGNQAASLLEGKRDKARLDTIEPNLYAVIELKDPLGHLNLHVEITPDHLQQKHEFDFEIDLSYLPSLIEQCERIGREYALPGS